MAKVSKKGIAVLSLTVIIIAILFTPPDFYVAPETVIVQEDIDQADVDAINLFLQSVVNTDVILTNSDQSIIEQFLDNTGAGLTEKFGIVTNVAVFDSDQNKITSTDVFGIPQLSLVDENGISYDLGSIQVTMQGISKNIESSVNIWGKVNFILDDTIIDSKFIWASTQNTQNSDLSIVDSLSFKGNTGNAIVQAEIDLLNAELLVITGRTIDFGTLSNVELKAKLQNEFDIKNTLDADRMKDRLFELRKQFTSDIELSLPPTFSQQEKKNHTFTLSDEGRDWVDQSTHTYRVVITEVHAQLDSTGESKEFHWYGQNVVYELSLKVNGAKRVILGDDNKAIEIFKSDNKLVLCGTNIYQSGTGFNPINTVAQPPSVTVTDLDGNILLQASYTHVTEIVNHNAISGTSCGTFTGIPRDSDLIFKVGGSDILITTPLHQANYNVSAELVEGSRVTIKCPFDVNRICGGYSNYSTSFTTNFT